MNTQEVTDSHTLKVTQTETHKNTTYGVQRERQLYSDTHRQTDRCEQAHEVTTTHTGSHGHGGSDTQRQAQLPSKSPQQRQSETEGQKVGLSLRGRQTDRRNSSVTQYTRIPCPPSSLIPTEHHCPRTHPHQVPTPRMHLEARKALHRDKALRSHSLLQTTWATPSTPRGPRLGQEGG